MINYRPPRITRKSYRPRASDRTMVDNVQPRSLSCFRIRERRHENRMDLRTTKIPRASQHEMGWKAPRTFPLLPVVGEFFLLTFPFIERACVDRTDQLPDSQLRSSSKRRSRRSECKLRPLVSGAFRPTAQRLRPAAQSRVPFPNTITDFVGRSSGKCGRQQFISVHALKRTIACF